MLNSAKHKKEVTSHFIIGQIWKEGKNKREIMNQTKGPGLSLSSVRLSHFISYPVEGLSGTEC